MKSLIYRLTTVCFAFIVTFAWPMLATAQTTKPQTQTPAATADRGWPRKFAGGNATFAIYQPQVDEWVGNRFSARAAFEVTETQDKQPAYGVLWFNARTEIDKVNRLVTFSNFTITKVNFPAAPDRAAAYQAALELHVQTKGEVIALDRLLADMAINQSTTANSGYDVKNDPPKIIFNTRPSILILIDGSPELRPVKETSLERVINTRVLILRDPGNGKSYLRLMDGWMEASSIAGPWSPSSATSTDLQKALESAAATKQVDLLDGSAAGEKTAKPSLKEAAKQNALPEVYVSTSPAELLQTQGEPQVATIDGTQLIYVTNTENDIFVYTPNQNHYILVAGRWFSSQSMNGPWQFVAADQLPADFARIPENHAKASVLVSVAGTPQAKEAVAANSIPQTATIKRSATLTVAYDGAPRFKPIENTALEYAVNTSTAVIKFDSQSFYAVQNGVWFVSTNPMGPWAVATSVPVALYSIPVSSRLHYVTYVKIYESTPDVVYVGYTPGYYGTVVTSSNVVVYGTGWYYPPYVGSYYWYGAPYTYGYGAAFTWGAATGWGLAYASGYAWSTYYYPAPYWGAYGYYGAAYYGAYGWGGVAATNVYGQWGNVAYSGTKAAWANPYTGNYGRGGAYTGTNTVTGTRYAARGGTNTNAYTGTTMTGGGAAAYNPNTGRISAGQAGAMSSPYTGNAAARTRGASYNPTTGVISGGSAGATRNGSTGQVTAAGSSFAYNTRTNSGVAVANNNVYASKDGNVYRYNPSTGAQQRTDGSWQNVQRSQDRSWLQNQNQARSLGQQRTQNFGAMRGNTGVNGGGLRQSGGGFRGGRRGR